MDAELVRTRAEEALADHEWAFERFFLARFLDLSISYGDETCRVELPVHDHLMNPQRTSLHGGVLAIAVDVSMGHLCNRFLGPCVTLSMQLQFLRPISERAVCEAHFLKKGATVVHLESRVSGADGRAAANATGVFHRLPDGDGSSS